MIVEEVDQLPRAVDDDEEVGAGEAEDDADLVGSEEDGVDDDLPVRVSERREERGLAGIGVQLPDDVRSLLAEQASGPSDDLGSKSDSGEEASPADPQHSHHGRGIEENER